MSKVTAISGGAPLADQLRKLADEIEAGELGFRPARGVLVLSAEEGQDTITAPFMFGCRSFVEAMGLLAVTIANQDSTGFNAVE